MLKAILLSLVTLMTFSAYAQWENPSERYTDVYKNYLGASCPIDTNNIKHFVYFARDRSALYEHSFLTNPRFSGAQIMYPWAQLEPTEGNYDFSVIEQDYEYLSSYGKTLFIQLQDATFTLQYNAVPAYMNSETYADGAIMQRNDEGEPEGWTAKRWNQNVQTRFSALLVALGNQFDGRIEGINLQETSIGVTEDYDDTFTPDVYADAVKANMLALKNAFPQSVAMQYANFMPGEWLPWEDQGYLSSIYAYGEEIGVGLGAPDLMVTRKGQLNHALAMMHETDLNVPLGIAVQDGNYIGQTNTTTVVNNRDNLVPLLHAFAENFLDVDYMFWVNQAPYFSQDVLPCFSDF
ncbi:MAG: hypothetical protein AAF267_17235 [Deinococcota bacterium]